MYTSNTLVFLTPHSVTKCLCHFGEVCLVIVVGAVVVILGVRYILSWWLALLCLVALHLLLVVALLVTLSLLYWLWQLRKRVCPLAVSAVVLVQQCRWMSSLYCLVVVVGLGAGSPPLNRRPLRQSNPILVGWFSRMPSMTSLLHRVRGRWEVGWLPPGLTLTLWSLPVGAGFAGPVVVSRDLLTADQLSRCPNWQWRRPLRPAVLILQWLVRPLFGDDRTPFRCLVHFDVVQPFWAGDAKLDKEINSSQTFDFSVYNRLKQTLQSLYASIRCYRS